MSTALWKDLSPIGAIEEMFATEIIRHSWRLRRCAAVEEQLAAMSVEQSGEAPGELADPMLSERSAPLQAAVDRARTQATGALNRVITQLRHVQTERWTREEIDIAPANVGVGSSRRVLDALVVREAVRVGFSRAASDRLTAGVQQTMQIPESWLRRAREENAKTKRTHLTPRNTPCPCGSGLKHKRCCGKDAPPVYASAA